MKQRFSDRIQGLVYIALIVFGIGLVVTGLILPPVGIIDNSVIIVFGEVLSFCGAIAGIDRKYDIRSKEIESQYKDRFSNNNKTTQ